MANNKVAAAGIPAPEGNKKFVARNQAGNLRLR